MSEKSPLDEKRLKELLIKYYSLNMGDSEVQELAGYCRRAPEIRLLLQRLDDKDLVERHVAHLGEADTEKNRELIRARLQAALVQVKAKWNVIGFSRRSLRWSLSIAALVLAITFTGVFLLIHKPVKEKNTLPVSIDKGLTPGHEKATLILGNGQVIEMDSSTIGKVINLEGLTFRQTGAGNLEPIQVPGFENLGQEKPDFMQYTTLQTPRGGQFSIMLPEGTKVWLNNASTLRIPVSFSRAERKVDLEGEAYFEVAKDIQLPFFVHLMVDGREQTVNVLSTSFNISAYPNEVTIRTTLVTGKIRVTSGGHSELLEPEEQVVTARDGMIRQKGVNVRKVLAWKAGDFNFMGDSLPDVMRQIARWYNKEVVLQGTLRPYTFASILSRSKPLPDLLATLADSNTVFHYTLEGNKIFISQ